MRERKYCLNGEYLPSSDIARKLGYLSRDVFRSRARKNGTTVQQEIDRESAAGLNRGETGRQKHFFVIGGRRMSLKEMSIESGINTCTLYSRIFRSGIEPADAMRPAVRKCLYTLNGEAKTTGEIGESLFLCFEALRRRAKKNGTTVQQEIDAEWERQRQR